MHGAILELMCLVPCPDRVLTRCIAVDTRSSVCIGLYANAQMHCLGEVY